MGIYNFNENEILLFALTFLRLSSFFVFWPILGTGTFPSQLKILFSFTISLLVFPTLELSGLQVLDLGAMALFVQVIKEIFIGLVLAFVVRMFFFAFQIMGEIVSISMGLSSAMLFNPQLGERESIMSKSLVIMASLFYLTINGHHFFVEGIVESFRLIPLVKAEMSDQFFMFAPDFFSQTTVIGLKLGGPVLLTVLFMNISMAVIGRAVPQINILITSLPVNILAGLLVLTLVTPVIVMQMTEVFTFSAEYFFKLMRSY